MKIIPPSKITNLKNASSGEIVKANKLFINVASKATWMRSLSIGEYASSWQASDYTLVGVMTWLYDTTFSNRTLLVESAIGSDNSIEISHAEIAKVVMRRVAFSAKYRRNSDNKLFELPLKVASYVDNFAGNSIFNSNLAVYGSSDGSDRSFLPINGSGSKAGKSYYFFNQKGIVLYSTRGSTIATLDVNDIYTNPNESTSLTVSSTSFDRQVVIAEKKVNPEIIVRSSLFVRTNAPLAMNDVVTVATNNDNLPAGGVKAAYDENAFSEFIHVNQLGYHPNYGKYASVSEYAGNGGEISLAGINTFQIIDAVTSAVVYTGDLVYKKETQYGNKTWYQEVKEINFTNFSTPGCYKIKIPWIGTSMPFHIDKGITWMIGRLVTRGLYNLRCGCATEIPYTRQTHAPCHMNAVIPLPSENYPVIWGQMAGTKSNYQIAPAPKNESELLYPYLRSGSVDCSGGHHDAGDFGRYDNNMAGTVWWLMTAVDHFGCGDIDNIGLPNSGNGKSDLIAEAIWDCDCICKWQESDGGIYAISRPKNRYYDDNVSLQLGDQGDEQAMFGKDIVGQNHYIVALARTARSPYLLSQYGQEYVTKYTNAAIAAWDFVQRAFALYGKAGALQAMRFNGQQNGVDDDYASACVEMYLLTGDQKYHTELLTSPTLRTGAPWDPTNLDLIQWSWNRDTKDPGSWVTISYAFAAKDNLRALNSTYLTKCQTVLNSWGTYLLNGVEKSAFRDGQTEQYKRNNDGNWLFSPAECIGLAVSGELTNDAALQRRYIDAYISCWNHFLGSNATNTSFLTGVGINQFWENISQYRENNPDRIIPPTGIIVADACKQWYQANLPSKDSVKNQFFPETYSRPFMNRVSDTFYVGSELIVVQQGAAVAGGMWLAAKTTPELKSQVYKGIEGSISGLTYYPEYGVPVRAELTAQGVTPEDMSKARIVWEGSYSRPVMGGAESSYLNGQNYTFLPQPGGVKRLEAEAQLIDGRVVIARSEYIYQKVPDRRISDFLDMNDPNIIMKNTWENSSYVDSVGGIVPTVVGDPYIDNISWKGTPAVKVSTNQNNCYFDINMSKELLKGTTQAPFTGVYLDFMVYPIWNVLRETSTVFRWFTGYQALNMNIVDGYVYREAIGGFPIEKMSEFRLAVPSNQWHHIRIRLTATQTATQINGGTWQTKDSTMWNATTYGGSLRFGAWGGWIGPVVLRKIV